MPSRPLFPENLKELLDLVQKGKLFALQEWIRLGKPVRFPDVHHYKAQILSVAVDTGFHSLVEELLRLVEWDRSELAEALECAFSMRRSDLTELLFGHGAKVSDIDFQTICRTMDLDLMERFLREGGDPGRDNAFAHVLSETKARPLLRFYRSFRVEFPSLDDQAALALSEAVNNGQVRWVALLAWAGADPFRPVPWELGGSFPVEQEYSTTAATRAIWQRNPDLLKVLKLKPNPAQSIELLESTVYCLDLNLFRSLLENLSPEQLNNSDRGSCRTLEKFVARSIDRDIWSRTPTGKGESETLHCVELLLDKGARWDPPPEEFRGIRRATLEHDGRYIAQLLRLLIYTPKAAPLESILEVCRSQTLQSRITAADPPLAQELKELRKHGPSSVSM